MIVFDIVAILLILFFAGFFSGAFSLLPPWVALETASPTYHPDIHRWHSAIWGVYPASSSLFHFSREGGWSMPLLIGSALATLLIAPDIWRTIALQLNDKTSEHTMSMHWVISFAVDILLLVASFLASTKRAGWMPLCIILGIAFLYLGAAALSVPTQAGSWGTIGGMLAILGGLGYLAVTVFEKRATTKRPQESLSHDTKAVGMS